MKSRTLMVAVAAMVSLALSACAGNQPKTLNPQQVAAIACPQLNLVHTQLAAFNTALQADPATAATGYKGTAQLGAIHPLVVAVCHGASAAPAVDASSLQALVNTGLPALASLAASLPLPPQQQAQVQAALVVAETATGIVSVVQQQINAQVAPAQAASAAKP